MRVLVTGLGTYWGSRVAKALEALDEVEVVVGVDTHDPVLPLERTEFVRADSSFSILNRIVQATQVDTIVHTHLIVDSTKLRSGTLHEINVIGTMNLLAAAGAADSPVRKVVLKSSTLVYGSTYQDPYFFREETRRVRGAHTPVERSLLEVSGFVRDFAEDNPHVTVTKLRFSNVLGEGVDTPFTKAFRRPVVPEIFGFDPRMQFTHEDDVIGALVYGIVHDVPGVYNVAGDGTLPWSEVCAIVGKPRVPLSPVATDLAARPLRAAGLLDLPPELLDLLRYGRGVDNSRYKRAGYRYEFTSFGTIQAFARALRLEHVVGDARPQYRYERDVEQFFRHSPAVVHQVD
ncbi:MAG TPA: NAD-dependent epimerase/dehydratase family protein [Acidimicrobiia bacterium]|nr:NAD-dependent epimerase/dehydratase family protein [Acidimicrobiia bacterium]